MLQVIIDVGVSKSKLSQPFVKEAFQKYGTGSEEDEQEEEQLRHAVKQHEVEIMELQKSMAVLKK